MSTTIGKWCLSLTYKSWFGCNNESTNLVVVNTSRDLLLQLSSSPLQLRINILNCWILSLKSLEVSHNVSLMTTNKQRRNLMMMMKTLNRINEWNVWDTPKRIIALTFNGRKRSEELALVSIQSSLRLVSCHAESWSHRHELTPQGTIITVGCLTAPDAADKLNVRERQTHTK